ncbi:hypothetical protein OQ496_06125 [Acetobacter suratthaniensis]|nr:hypothetical protein [Acetobacter suratthaniensis]MCX2566033.1 hypothetical protein [Acetobacter suratthaniensis]
MFSAALCVRLQHVVQASELPVVELRHLRMEQGRQWRGSQSGPDHVHDTGALSAGGAIVAGHS